MAAKHSEEPLYGFYQASREWKKYLNTFLFDMSCEESNVDATLYFLRQAPN